MDFRRVLAILLALVVVFGIISSASTATACRFCGESATLTEEDGSDPDLLYYWQYHKTIPNYGRWVWECWHSYECGYCHMDWTVRVTHYGPWQSDG